MTNSGKIITIFGSSRPKDGEEDYRLAYELGKECASAGFTICNGGYGGIMEASARGAKEAGGKTIGITFANPFGINANLWIEKELKQRTLVERLMKLIELGDAYIVLKGGTGTLLEFSAVWEFINKKLLKEKPIIVIGDFWMNVVNAIRDEVYKENIQEVINYIHHVTTPKECVAVIKKVFNE